MTFKCVEKETTYVLLLLTKYECFKKALKKVYRLSLTVEKAKNDKLYEYKCR